jgi:hypothetical protein
MSFLRGICFFDSLNYVITAVFSIAIAIALKGHDFSRALSKKLHSLAHGHDPLRSETYPWGPERNGLCVYSDSLHTPPQSAPEQPLVDWT